MGSITSTNPSQPSVIKSIQRGKFAVSGGRSQTVTISTVDPSKTWVNRLGVDADVELSSATQVLGINRRSTNNTVYYEVVEYV
ncbi:MAG: hypothetical protein OXI69_15565 [Acidobacteriota bacterium]|nr:hypothetical protein [Acidobacteriota bacterium]